MMEVFCENSGRLLTVFRYIFWNFFWKPLAIFLKSSTMDIWQGPIYTSVSELIFVQKIVLYKCYFCINALQYFALLAYSNTEK